MDIFISFILPIYKVDIIFLRECITSLRNQNLKNIEIILVDDGSPDSCGDVCDELAVLDERIRVIHQFNQGVSAARNAGIKIAKGAWICFVDPDDWVEENMTRDLYNFIDTLDKIVDVIYFDYIKESGNSSRKESLGLFEGVISKDVEQALHLAPLHKLFMNKKYISYAGEVVWNKIYRADFIRETGVLFPVGIRRGEDRVFNAMILRKSKNIGYCRKNFYHYRVTEGSATNQYTPNIVEKVEPTLKILSRWIYENRLPQLYQDTLNVYISNRFYSYLRLDYLNPKSKYKYFEVRKKIVDIASRDPYYSALNRVKKDNMRFEEKIFISFLKMGWYDICIILAWVRNRIKKL